MNRLLLAAGLVLAATAASAAEMPKQIAKHSRWCEYDLSRAGWIVVNHIKDNGKGCGIGERSEFWLKAKEFGWTETTCTLLRVSKPGKTEQGDPEWTITARCNGEDGTDAPDTVETFSFHLHKSGSLTIWSRKTFP